MDSESEDSKVKATGLLISDAGMEWRLRSSPAHDIETLFVFLKGVALKAFPVLVLIGYWLSRETFAFSAVQARASPQNVGLGVDVMGGAGGGFSATCWYHPSLGNAPRYDPSILPCAFVLQNWEGQHELCTTS